jgi:hypothetical protein
MRLDAEGEEAHEVICGHLRQVFSSAPTGASARLDFGFADTRMMLILLAGRARRAAARGAWMDQGTHR